MSKFVAYLPYVKKFLVALGAAIAVLILALADSVVTGLEWAQIGAAFLGALGVFGVANRPTE